MLGLWRRWRRARLLGEPFPADWLLRIELDVALWRVVPEASRPRLLDDVRVFVAERSWEPCGGLRLEPPMCAVIAAQACVLTLGRTVDAFSQVRSVLVYPDWYRAADVWEDEAGVVTEEEDERTGEAAPEGAVVLAWNEVVRDARTLNGRNLVLHEFAHHLDLLDVVEAAGAVDQGEPHRRWRETFLEEYEAFCEEVDRGHRVKGLDEYGAEDEAEFFAVATESFFERGAFLKQHQARLYEVLAGYYNQDPASWPPSRRPDFGEETARERRRRRREEERRLRKVRER